MMFIIFTLKCYCGARMDRTVPSKPKLCIVLKYSFLDADILRSPMSLNFDESEVHPYHLQLENAMYRVG